MVMEQFQDVLVSVTYSASASSKEAFLQCLKCTQAISVLWVIAVLLPVLSSMSN
jgi:hypothetical protein